MQDKTVVSRRLNDVPVRSLSVRVQESFGVRELEMCLDSISEIGSGSVTSDVRFDLERLESLVRMVLSDVRQ
jgi:hypothetical protein